MTQPTLNTRLIDSLTQIILSLSETEQEILAHQLQNSLNSAEGITETDPTLKADIEVGLQQLKTGQYNDYTPDSLPNLIEAIKMRGRQRLKEES
ncbi:hypothetical protein PN462_02145 [Spirulina sp. CS-785/01]|uniref:hypothetical protein n=1 Tax=Spirulina sp. CS-785/01 TaxID=3021716 RepID=UPI002330DCA5|nr:hypothetical protein [Spirulina sp. CS-785/01]MDB9311887.1 hypothetical protein [Spirulina sp. CS-785/01]